MTDPTLPKELRSIEEFSDALRKAEAQKERCAGMTAGEWRGLFLRTQDQWEAAKNDRDMVGIAFDALKRQRDDIVSRAQFPKWDRHDPAVWVLLLLANGEISHGKACQYLREYISTGVRGPLPDIQALPS